MLGGGGMAGGVNLDCVLTSAGESGMVERFPRPPVQRRKDVTQVDGQSERAGRRWCACIFDNTEKKNFFLNFPQPCVASRLLKVKVGVAVTVLKSATKDIPFSSPPQKKKKQPPI